jgi:hypothetical protein
MQTPELKTRHEASAILAQMLLIITRSLLEGYNRNKNVAAVWPEMMVLMAILLNDARHCKQVPISANRIAKGTGLPRQSVDRWLVQLIKHHVVKQGIKTKGYVTDDSFLQARLNARYFKRIVRAIHAAANLLKDYN